MTIFINPGSGPVAGASEASARANLEKFIEDLKEKGCRAEPNPHADFKADGQGRWETSIIVEGEEVEIDMPGLPLEKVRWLSEESGSIWDFPRLYVDGSSWIWKFALDACTAKDDEEK